MKHKIDKNLWHIIEFNKKHEFELVLDRHEVVRLVGISIAEDDYYWVIMDSRGEFNYESCVGSPWPLKGILPKEQYEYLDYFFKINNVFASEEEITKLHEEYNKRK